MRDQCSARYNGLKGKALLAGIQRMHEIAEVSLSQLGLLEGARIIRQSDAAILVTAPGQWHYSAEAVFDLPQGTDLPVSINLGIEVELGRLGIGWLDAEGSAW